MKTLGSVAAVADAIRGEAEADAERISRETAEAIAAWRPAREESGSPPGADERLAEARREARESLAREDATDRREALEARETWIRLAAAEGGRRLAAEPDATARRERLLRLAREALEALRRAEGPAPGEGYRIAVSPADAPLLDSARLGVLAAASGIGPNALALSSDERLGGGCLAATADGRLSFDNTFESRARRLEPVWRAALGALHGS